MFVNRHHWVHNVTGLFWLSLALMVAHVVDDAFVGEAGWWGVSIGEFLVFNALLYLIAPPIGLFLARLGHRLGLGIVLVYGLQAFYGGGLNHVRHLMGDFRGSQLLPSVLNSFGIQIGQVSGRGLLTGILWLFGLGTTPPHSHSLLSNLLVFLAVGVNLALILFCTVGLFTSSRRRI